jgi:hypothetical protein
VIFLLLSIWPNISNSFVLIFQPTYEINGTCRERLLVPAGFRNFNLRVMLSSTTLCMMARIVMVGIIMGVSTSHLLGRVPLIKGIPHALDIAIEYIRIG